MFYPMQSNADVGNGAGSSQGALHGQVSPVQQQQQQQQQFVLLNNAAGGGLSSLGSASQASLLSGVGGTAPNGMQGPATNGAAGNSLFMVYPLPQQQPLHHSAMYSPLMPHTDASTTTTAASGMTFHNISGQLYATAPNGALIPVVPAPPDLMSHSNPAMGSFHHSGPLNEFTAQQQMSLSGNLAYAQQQHQQQLNYNAMMQQQQQQQALGSQGFAMMAQPTHGGWAAAGQAMPAPPPPPGPPPQHHNTASFGSFGHSPSHNNGNNNSFQQQPAGPSSGSGQQQLIQRTGNVHDGLRQQGCLYIPYEGPVISQDACVNRSRLKPVSAANLSSSSSGGVTGTPPLGSPSSSSGMLPTMQQAMSAEESATATATATASSSLLATPKTSVDNIAKMSESLETVTVTASSTPATSHQIVHFFVSSFPTEKMECAQRLLTRVLQTVASGVDDIPLSCAASPSECSIPAVAFLPWVESIAFMNPSSRGSSHSFYAKVHAHNAQALLERVKGNVMMDRMGFHWAVVPASKKHLEQYSKSIWNLPQVLRHRRTEWLPCTPLILDVAMDTSRLKWQTQW